MHQSLVLDLLEFSRVGKRCEEPLPIDANKACQEALANLQLGLAECDGEVTCDDLPLVMGDDLQLVQLFQNLSGNGIKYRDESRRPEIHVSVMPRDDAWVFSVRDNGIGIGKQYFSRVFEIFKRLHARGKYSGTGIGLAICKKIVERLGGKIWIESEEGVGSTFYFTMAKVSDAYSENEFEPSPGQSRDDLPLVEVTHSNSLSSL